MDDIEAVDRMDGGGTLDRLVCGKRWSNRSDLWGLQRVWMLWGGRGSAAVRGQ